MRPFFSVPALSNTIICGLRARVSLLPFPSSLELDPKPSTQHLAPSTRFSSSRFLLTLMSISALVAEFCVATGPLSCLRKVTGPKPTPQLTLWGTSRLVENFHVPHLMCPVLRTGLRFPCDRDLASRSPHLWVRAGHLAWSPGPSLEPQSGAPGQGPSSP